MKHSQEGALRSLPSTTFDNTSYCIGEKLKKISPYLEQYVEWWLLFVDGISYGLDSKEIDTVRQHIEKPSEVSKIIVVSRKTKKQVLVV